MKSALYRSRIRKHKIIMYYRSMSLLQKVKHTVHTKYETHNNKRLAWIGKETSTDHAYPPMLKYSIWNNKVTHFFRSTNASLVNIKLTVLNFNNELNSIRNKHTKFIKLFLWLSTISHILCRNKQFTQFYSLRCHSCVVNDKVTSVLYIYQCVGINLNLITILCCLFCYIKTRLFTSCFRLNNFTILLNYFP